MIRLKMIQKCALPLALFASATAGASMADHSHRAQAAGIDVVSYQAQDQVYADLAAGRLDAAFQDAEAASKGFLKTPQGAGFANITTPTGVN